MLLRPVSVAENTESSFGRFIWFGVQNSCCLADHRAGAGLGYRVIGWLGLATT
ncbi:hypothetical protein LguiB_008970 [Lonicera macranthoides]